MNLTNTQKKEIIEYYNAPHSGRDTCKEFNLTRSEFEKLLKEFSIKQRDRKTAQKLSAYKYTIILSEEKEHEVISYYLKPSSLAATTKEFNLKNPRIVLRILQKYNIQVHEKETTKKLKADKKAKIQSKDAEQAIVSFYLFPHTLATTCKYFNCTKSPILCVLAKNKICVRTKDEDAKIRSAQIEKENKNKLLAKYNFQEIKEYYLCHSKKETLEYFNLTDDVFSKLIKWYNFHKPTNLVVEQRIKNNLKKYGVENVFQLDNTKDKIKETCLLKYGVENAALNQTVHSRICKRYTYNNVYFDSSYELALWIYATDHNQKIIREPCSFEYCVKNKKHYCFPDFNYLGELIEIKGDHLLTSDKKIYDVYSNNQDKAIAKQKCLEENNVKLYTKTDIQFAINYCVNRYKSKFWYKQFKNK